MNSQYKMLMLSTVKVLCVSGLITTAAYFTALPLFLTFVVATVSQYIGFYAWDTYLEWRGAIAARELLLKEAEFVSKNTLKVKCAACKKDSDVVVRLDRDNKFICGFCNVKNSIYISTETAVVTEPKYENEPNINTNSTNGINRSTE